MQARILLLGFGALLSLSCYGDYTIELGLDRDSSSSEDTIHNDFAYFDPTASVNSFSFSEIRIMKLETDSNTLRGRFYLGRVDSADLPLAELGLFSRQSNIGLSVDVVDSRLKVRWRPIDSGGFGQPPLVASSTSRDVSVSSDVEWITPGLPFIVGLSLATVESKTDNDSPGGNDESESDTQSAGLQLGVFIDDWTTLRYHYSQTKTEGFFDLEGRTHTLTMRRLVSLSNGQHLSVWASYAGLTSELEGLGPKRRNEELGFGLNYYPSRALQLSLGYRNSQDSDDSDNGGDEYHYGLSYFFNDTVGLSLLRRTRDSDYVRSDTDASTTSVAQGEMDSDSIKLGLDLRF